MCTAIVEFGKYPLFGRTLDLEDSLGECVVITPPHFPLSFLCEKAVSDHPSIVGTALLQNGSPLYFDAVNNAGLAVAGLNFPNYAVYLPPKEGKYNLASFELIPWLLSHCTTVSEAYTCLKNINILPDSFSPTLPATPLHWLIADATDAIVAEPTENGLQLWKAPLGILTNAPNFSYQMTHLADFMGLSATPIKNRLCPSLSLPHYSRGMGNIGLPGDFSSSSRFVRGSFVKLHADHHTTKTEEISRFFHVLDTVSVPCGCVQTKAKRSVQTVYSCCTDLHNGEYFFTTYTDRQIRSVTLSSLDPNEAALLSFPMNQQEEIRHLNR